MALHHFYSCVPAKLSIYRKADGYDTFAKSADLTDDFIQSELMAICNYKETKNELSLIRDHKLSPAYATWLAKDKQTLIQSCISYTDKDYTGEKSSHLIHSLILDPEEKLRLTSADSGCVINKAMFVSDMASLDCLSDNLKMRLNHPVGEYLTAPSSPPEEILLSYPDRIIKRLLFALLSVACNKGGKTVYITFDSKKVEEISSTALNFMNAILTLFPYTLRCLIPFITYQSDYAKFPQFKVKFLPSDCMSIPSGKGYQFDMTTRLPDGIKEEEYALLYPVVELLYSMIENKTVRSSFIHFYDEACRRFPEQLTVPSIKTLCGMVMLFHQSSGLFDTKKLLRDDKVTFELFSVYEKYRKALNSTQRSAVYSSVEKYLSSHSAIPQDVFGKFCRLYPSESEDTKQTAMDIILRMMHTDIMRQKLFPFIKNNFDSETPKMKERICTELCSVFYGGFLQSQIMELLFPDFFQEPSEIRINTLNTMLSSIRTVSVQTPILTFLTENFHSFSSPEKDLTLTALLPMLSESDELSSKLLDLFNCVIPDEAEPIRLAVFEGLWHIIASDQIRKEPRFLDILMQKKGYCENIVLDRIFKKKTKTQVNYFRKMTLGSLSDTADRVVRIYQNVTFVSNKLSKTFAKFVVALTKNAIKHAKLAEIVASDEIYSSAVLRLSPEGKALVAKVTTVFNEAIANALPTAFTQKGRQHVLPAIVEYVQRHKAVLGEERYFHVGVRCRLLASLDGNDISAMAKEAFSLTFEANDDLRADFADTLKADMALAVKKRSELLSGKTVVAFSLLIGVIRTGVLDAVFANEMLAEYLQKCPLSDEAIREQPLFANASLYVAWTVFAVTEELGKSVDRDQCLAALSAGGNGDDDETGCQRFAKTVYSRCGKKDYKKLIKALSSDPSTDPIREKILSILKSEEPSLRNKLKGLFRKNASSKNAVKK